MNHTTATSPLNLENLAIPVILESNFTIMQQTKSTEMMVSDEKSVTFGRQGPSRERIITIMILAVATIIFIVGIALIAVAAKEKGKGDGTSGTNAAAAAPSDKSAKCDYSEEAKRVGLGEFLDKVKSSYYKLHPYAVYDDPDVTPERIKKEYVAYDPTPSLIKIRTDTSLNLLKEINKKDINKAALKPREKKVVAQVKHYLQHVFGQPFDVNYYAGDWMMGPNKRCWQEICNIGRAVQNGLGRYFKPNDASDVELIETKLRTFNAGILQYIENMKMGIRKGMVRSKEACEVGFKALRSKYMKVYLNNETGMRSYPDVWLRLA